MAVVEIPYDENALRIRRLVAPTASWDAGRKRWAMDAAQAVALSRGCMEAGLEHVLAGMRVDGLPLELWEASSLLGAVIQRTMKAGSIPPASAVGLALLVAGDQLRAASRQFATAPAQAVSVLLETAGIVASATAATPILGRQSSEAVSMAVAKVRAFEDQTSNVGRAA